MVSLRDNSNSYTYIIGIGDGSQNAISSIENMGLTEARCLFFTLNSKTYSSCQIKNKYWLSDINELLHNLYISKSNHIKHFIVVCGPNDEISWQYSHYFTAKIGIEFQSPINVIATLPFRFMGPRRRRRDKLGISILSKHCPKVHIINNQSLLQSYDKWTTVSEAFGLSDSCVIRQVLDVYLDNNYQDLHLPPPHTALT